MQTMGAMELKENLVLERAVLHADPSAYCAHPHLVAARPDNWLLVFTRSVRRELVLHPPQDPLYCNMLMRSADEGRNWTEPVIVPSSGWRGVECAGLTTLRSGRVLLNQWRFEWHTLAHARACLDPKAYTPSDQLMSSQAMAAELADWTPDPATIVTRFPWARGGGETWVHHSEDGGQSFTRSVRIATAPYSGGYGMRGGVELPDGEIVLSLSDVPNYRNVFVVRSRDGGESWSEPLTVAGGEGHEFEEPAPLLLRSGRLMMLLRDNGRRILHRTYSDDGGRSWSAAQATGITDYPADIIELADGRIACVCGRRVPPYAITLYVSTDEGVSWNADQPLMVHAGLPNRDLGYPSQVLRRDGSLFIAYYARDARGLTGIHSTIIDARALGSSGERN